MERLMVKLHGGVTIYVDATFAGSQPAFRDVTRRSALEHLQKLINPIYCAEPPRIVEINAP